METENGGWTLVASKVSPKFIFIKTAFSASAAKSTDSDAASHIHPDMTDWEEVMFRFNDVNTIGSFTTGRQAPQIRTKQSSKIY